MRKKIEKDKWKHFWVGIPLGIFLQAISFYYFTQPMPAILTAVVLLIVVCYGFELFSFMTKIGHHDLLDAIAGILGGAIGIVLVIVQKKLDLF